MILSASSRPLLRSSRANLALLACASCCLCVRSPYHAAEMTCDPSGLSPQVLCGRHVRSSTVRPNEKLKDSGAKTSWKEADTRGLLVLGLAGWLLAPSGSNLTHPSLFLLCFQREACRKDTKHKHGS